MEKLPGAESKITEYVARIMQGEDKEIVLQGVGPAFRTPVLERVEELKKNTENASSVDTSTYTEQVYSSEHDVERINALKAQIQELYPPDEIEIERRKKLSGWEASYALATIAKKEGFDLSALTREEYAHYAIAHYLAIDDAQLRAQPWQRMETGVEDIVRKNKERKTSINDSAERSFAEFSFRMMERSRLSQEERYIHEDVRILSGTKDSNSWLFFSINNGTNNTEKETHKSYLSLKDLNKFSPEQFISFMELLQKEGYNGGVKIFQDLTEQGTQLNDQIVMHGYSQKEAERALMLAQEFFGENIEHTSMGKDEITSEGSKSYSQILADTIKEAIKATS